MRIPSITAITDRLFSTNRGVDLLRAFVGRYEIKKDGALAEVLESTIENLIRYRRFKSLQTLMDQLPNNGESRQAADRLLMQALPEIVYNNAFPDWVASMHGDEERMKQMLRFKSAAILRAEGGYYNLDRLAEGLNAHEDIFADTVMHSFPGAQLAILDRGKEPLRVVCNFEYIERKKPQYLATFTPHFLESVWQKLMMVDRKTADRFERFLIRNRLDKTIPSASATPEGLSGPR